MRLRTRLVAITFAGALTALVFASSAFALTDKIMIREVFLGGSGNDAFVELQMYGSGQNQVMGHQVRVYGDDGSFISESTNDGVNHDVDHGESQRTILIGDTAVQGFDFSYGPLTDVTPFIADGGAVCYMGSNDCVAWGNYSLDPGATQPPPSPVGTTVLPGGIPVGSSITRKLTRGCKTALDPADDTDNSAADFARTPNPSPRGNSTAPTERVCVPCGGKQSTITGTNARDVLRGTPGKDVIAGLGGNDVLKGRGGRDILCGGPGRDKLVGGPGKDKLKGGPGRDTQIQ